MPMHALTARPRLLQQLPLSRRKRKRTYSLRTFPTTTLSTWTSWTSTRFLTTSRSARRPTTFQSSSSSSSIKRLFSSTGNTTTNAMNGWHSSSNNHPTPPRHTVCHTLPSISSQPLHTDCYDNDLYLTRHCMEFGVYIQTAEKDIQNWMGVCIVAFGIWTLELLFYCLFVVQEKRISAHLISVSFIDDIQYFMNEGYDTLSIQFYSIS
ncbi:hypothetical protein DL95DRAFT_395896, partial [Leptodontidium sp. 2 PMI_412]